jgi:hypothetical protein
MRLKKRRLADVDKLDNKPPGLKPFNFAALFPGLKPGAFTEFAGAEAHREFGMSVLRCISFMHMSELASGTRAEAEAHHSVCLFFGLFLQCTGVKSCSRGLRASGFLVVAFSVRGERIPLP